MKKLFLFAAIVLAFTTVFAQDEAVGPLGYNPAVYQATKNQRPAHQHRYFIDRGNLVVSTDTLHLPFVDDFSSNRAGTPGWNSNPAHIIDTVYNAFGTCLALEGVELTQGYFMNDTSWQYTYNTTLHQVDSTPNPRITFPFFGPGTSACLASPPDTFAFHYWQSYYRFDFDSQGHKLDSTLVQPTDTFYYAPVIYFVQGQTGTLWADAEAYINNTYPINPPTIGVATLDGLNEFGLPYNNSNNHTYGTADHLTSKPINLTGFTGADSIYLSFFVEPKGLGDYPDLYDSLILEFKDNNGLWREVWHDTGYVGAGTVPDTAFRQVLIYVEPLQTPYSYYYNTFQFRFRNQASLYGNNDHWHIDYVKLDRNRFADDTIIHDVAFMYPFPSILKNFTMMPADQFNYGDDLKDNILISVHNLDPNAHNNPPATNFVKNASRLYPTPVVVIAPDILQTFNADVYSTIEVNPKTEYVMDTTTWPVDSLVILSTTYIQPNDSRAQNDTLRHVQAFDNVMAYDDGSAELAYGVTGLGLKKFAYEFTLNHPDTLVAFQVQFSQIEENVQDLIFNWYIWDSLKMNDFQFNDGDTSVQIYSRENSKPFYVDSVNGFATYTLETPLQVSGKVYLGWAQTDTRRLQVGYDLNSQLGRPHMYVFSNSTWKPSSITPNGSPMIRLVFDSNWWGGTSAIDNVADVAEHVSVYPNPTTGLLQIKSGQNAQFNATVTNLLGETVLQQPAVSTQLDISNLQTGVYLLSLRNAQSGKASHYKIIKTGL